MRAAIGAAAILTATGCAPWRADARAWQPEQTTIAGELRAQARPLAGLDGEVPEAAVVWDMVRGARVIGVGEGTHGTREFRRLMYALVRHAAEDGPLVVAIELPFNATLGVDAWAGDAWYPIDPAIRSRAFTDDEVFGTGWLYAVEEQREIFAWIREWNAAAPAGRKIRIAGADACMSPGCGTEVAKYVEGVDPKLLEVLQGYELELRRSPALAERARAGLAELRRDVEGRREQVIARGGEYAYSTALRLVWLAERRVEVALAHGDGPGSSGRDAIMAQTVAWLADELGPGGRVIVLAHNGHVGRARDEMPNGRLEMRTKMGAELAARFGDDYAVVHTTFDAGEFLAHHTRSGLAADSLQAGRLRAFSVSPAPDGTLEATLQSDEAYALDVRAATGGGGALARWLRARHRTRSHGYAWKRALDAWPVAWDGTVPADDFDVLVYFPRATATRALTRE